MIELPPYNFARCCPKCGHARVATRWSPGSKHDDVPEHLVRTCERCGYWWREAPLS